MKSALQALAICAAGGALASVAHLPLPWMIGPLLAMAVCRLSGMQLRAPSFARPTGQVIIGTALGLYFTPPVMRAVGTYLPEMIFAGFFSMLTGYLSSVVLQRGAGTDRVTAFFASVPGGAAEMSVLGERFGAKSHQVAAGQSLRIAVVVVLFPSVFQTMGLTGSDAYEQAQRIVEPLGLAALLTACAVGALLLRYFEIPNGFTIGALFTSIVLTLSGATWSAMHPAVTDIGQLLIGCTLGSRFEPDFLHSAPRFLAALVVSILLAVVLSVGCGLTLAWLMNEAAPTMVLATAPGGIAEMSITAKVLRLGVPVVTAFHVTRMVLIVTLTAPLFRLAQTWSARHNARIESPTDLPTNSSSEK